MILYNTQSGSYNAVTIVDWSTYGENRNCACIVFLCGLMVKNVLCTPTSCPQNPCDTKRQDIYTCACHASVHLICGNNYYNS